MLPRTAENSVVLLLNALDKHAAAEFSVLGGHDAQDVRGSVRFIVGDMTVSLLKEKDRRNERPGQKRRKRGRTEP